MKLTFDIPKEYNDMTDSDIGKLYMEIKKLVVALEFALDNIGYANLSRELTIKLDNTSSEIDLIKREIKRINEKIEAMEVAE